MCGKRNVSSCLDSIIIIYELKFFRKHNTRRIWEVFVSFRAIAPPQLARITKIPGQNEYDLKLCTKSSFRTTKHTVSRSLKPKIWYSYWYSNPFFCGRGSAFFFNRRNFVWATYPWFSLILEAAWCQFDNNVELFRDFLFNLQPISPLSTVKYSSPRELLDDSTNTLVKVQKRIVRNPNRQLRCARTNRKRKMNRFLCNRLSMGFNDGEISFTLTNIRPGTPRVSRFTRHGGNSEVRTRSAYAKKKKKIFYP